MIQKIYSVEIEKTMKDFYKTLSEKDKRRYAAIEAIKLGHGGQKYISQVLGCDPATIKLGNDELALGIDTLSDRVRQPGGGNKRIIDKIENIDEIFLEILKNNTAGSPMDENIKWTNLSPKDISKAFKEKGLEVTRHVVKQLLRKHKFVDRKMQKSKTMKETKNRNEQFENIQQKVEEYANNNNPVISMDVKKKNT